MDHPRSAHPFTHVIDLRRYEPGAEVSAVRTHYEKQHGTTPEDTGGWYHDADWRRIGVALDTLAPGGRFLDVGVGAGQFVNAVAMRREFSEVHGVDRFRFNKYEEFGGVIRREDAGIDALPFPDDHFDVVTCMEVLEHLDPPVLRAGLDELRRVCRGQLLMSVPFEEPEPIYEGHRRRFVAADLEQFFPESTRVLLYRPSAPWALIEERHGAGAGACLREVGDRIGEPWGARWKVRAASRRMLTAAIRRVRHVGR